MGRLLLLVSLTLALFVAELTDGAPAVVNSGSDADVASTTSSVTTPMNTFVDTADYDYGEELKAVGVKALVDGIMANADVERAISVISDAIPKLQQLPQYNVTSDDESTANATAEARKAFLNEFITELFNNVLPVEFFVGFGNDSAYDAYYDYGGFDDSEANGGQWRDFETEDYKGFEGKMGAGIPGILGGGEADTEVGEAVHPGVAIGDNEYLGGREDVGI